MNRDLIPETSFRESAEIYRRRPEWKRFASLLPKHPFVRERMVVRDSPSGCAWCSKPFGSNIANAQLHHIDYNNFCSYPLTKLIACPTPKRPARTRLLPDCEGCYYDNRSGFDECAARIVLVHGFCNLRIEEARLSAKGRA